MLEYFLEQWLTICDWIMGYTVDFIEAFALALFTLPVIFALVLAFVRWWWSKRSHKIALGLMFLMIGILPVFLLTVVIVILRNREPLLEGTHRNMRKFCSRFATMLSRIE